MTSSLKANLVRLFSLSSVYTLGSVSEQTLNFFLIPLYLACLSPEEYGVYALIGLTESLLTSAATVPVNTALGRFYYAPDLRERHGEFVFTMALFAALNGAIMAAAMAAGGRWCAETLLGGAAYVNVVYGYAIVALLEPLCAFCDQFLRLEEKARTYAVLAVVRIPVMVGVTVFLLVSAKMGVMALAWGNVASRAVTLAVVAPSLLARCRFAACPSLLAEPLRYAYPLLPAGYSVLLINSGDRYVLRLFTTVETVGLYSLAYKLSQAVSILLTVPLKNAIQPVAMKQEDQPEELKQFLARGATYTYAVALFLGLGLAVFSPEILRVLAPKRPAYWESAPIIPALAMAQALQCLQVFLGMGMVMAKASWLMSSILFACLALSLGLNFLLVPAIGLMGAALANATTYAVWSALKARYSQATYKMRFEARRLWLLSAAGPAMYGVSLLIVPSEISAASVIAKALVLTAFPVALCFSGFLLDSEKRAVSQWLGRA